MTDRQPSLLTNSQREFLAEGGAGAKARMTRKRIRERVQSGLYDYPLLVSGLDAKDRDWIFKHHDLESEEPPINVVPSAFAFLYLGVVETIEPGDRARDAFEGMIADGVREAYRTRGDPVADVSVSIDVEPIDSSKPVEDMTLAEIQDHAKAGNMDRQVLLQRLTEAFEEHDDPDGSLSAEHYDIDRSRAEWFVDMLTAETNEDTEE